MELRSPTSRRRGAYSCTSHGPTTTTDDVAAHATTTNAIAVTNDATARYGNAVAHDGWWYARNDARYATAKTNDGRNAGYDANGWNVTTHDGRYARNDASTNARDDGYVATNDGGHAWNDANGRYADDVIFFYYDDHHKLLFLFHYDDVIDFF